MDKLPKWFSVMLVPKLLLTPIKIRIFGPKTAKFGPKYAFLVILAKYCHFLYILSNAGPKNNVNKVPRWVFRYMGNKTFDFSSRKKDCLPKNDPIWPEIGISIHFGPGLAGSVGALLVGWLVVVAHGLYRQDTYLLSLTNPDADVLSCVSWWLLTISKFLTHQALCLNF